MTRHKLLFYLFFSFLFVFIHNHSLAQLFDSDSPSAIINVSARKEGDHLLINLRADRPTGIDVFWRSETTEKLMYKYFHCRKISDLEWEIAFDLNKIRKFSNELQDPVWFYIGYNSPATSHHYNFIEIVAKEAGCEGIAVSTKISEKRQFSVFLR